METIYVSKDNDGKSPRYTFKDSALTELSEFICSMTHLVRKFNSVTWIGEGGQLGEEHGTFLSAISVIETKKKYEYVICNRITHFDKDFKTKLEEGVDVNDREDVSVFFKEVVKCYGKVIKKQSPEMKELVNATIFNALFDCIYPEGLEFQEVVPPSEEEEEVLLNDAAHLEEGKLAKINGEIVQVKNIMAEDRTGKKILVPVRFKERFLKKGDPEAVSQIKALGETNKTVMKDVLKNHGKLHHLQHRIPDYDPTFLLNRPEYMDFIKLFTAQGFSKILLSGDAGVGKSELVQQVCSRMNMPLMRIDFSGEIIAEQILWGQNYNPETKKMEVEEGIIPYCVRNGVKLCLEEFSSIPPSVAFELHRLFEKGNIYIKDNDTLIEPHPNFSIVATDNRIGNPNFQKYFGTQQQNAALISRIENAIWIPYPPKKLEMDYLTLKFDKVDELMVVNEHAAKSESLLELIVNFANDVRPKYTQGELGFTISPRELVSFFNSFYKLEDLQKAFEYSILNFHRGFKSDETAITQLFEKYFGKKSTVDFASNVSKVSKMNRSKLLMKIETPESESPQMSDEF